MCDKTNNVLPAPYFKNMLILGGALLGIQERRDPGDQAATNDQSATCYFQMCFNSATYL